MQFLSFPNLIQSKENQKMTFKMHKLDKICYQEPLLIMMVRVRFLVQMLFTDRNKK